MTGVRREPRGHEPRPPPLIAKVASMLIAKVESRLIAKVESKWGDRWDSNPHYQGHNLACYRLHYGHSATPRCRAWYLRGFKPALYC